MPLYYRKNNTTYVIYYYDSLSELNGPGVSSSHYLAVRVDGYIKYIGLTTNLSHTHVSDMRVRINNTTYGVMIRSKYETQSLSRTSQGTSATLTIPNNAFDIQTSLTIKGACGGSQGGGGGGNSSSSWACAAASHQIGTVTARVFILSSGAGGSGGGPRCVGQTKNVNPTLLAGGQYRLNIGEGGNGSSGGGRGIAYCRTYTCCRTYGSDACAIADNCLVMDLFGEGSKAGSTSSGGSSYLQCYTGSSWSNLISASGGSGVNYTSYRNAAINSLAVTGSRCGVSVYACARSRGGQGGGGYSIGGAGSTYRATKASEIWNKNVWGGSGNTSGANGGNGARACMGANCTTWYTTRGSSGNSGSKGGTGEGSLSTCYWLNGN